MTEIENAFLKAANDIDNEINITESMKVLHNLADVEEYLPAVRRLGFLYGYKYDFIEQDYNKSDYYLQIAADNGDDYSLHTMGRTKWYRGDSNVSLELFNIGVDNNYLPSKYWLSWILGKEDHPFFDKEKSLKLLKEAAKQGHVASIRLYITRILEGEYGYLHILKVPLLFIAIIFRVIKYKKYDPDDCLIR